jgi:hypothetical protein
MRKFFFAFTAVIAFVLVSCNDYGKKVKINDNLEIYVKGNGVTENDARKLGNYLAELSGDSKNQKSLQLSKDSGQYEVRMVVDQEKMKTDSVTDVNFTALKTLMETQVFNNQPVRLTLTDDHFKDLKSY